MVEAVFFWFFILSQVAAWQSEDEALIRFRRVPAIILQRKCRLDLVAKTPRSRMLPIPLMLSSEQM